MKLIARQDGYYFFAPRKREDTDQAIDRISEMIKGEFHYIAIQSADDGRIDGYREVIGEMLPRVDFDKYNLILVIPVSPQSF